MQLVSFKCDYKLIWPVSYFCLIKVKNLLIIINEYVQIEINTNKNTSSSPVVISVGIETEYISNEAMLPTLHVHRRHIWNLLGEQMHLETRKREPHL